MRLMFLSVCKTISKGIQQLQVRNVSINLFSLQLSSIESIPNTPMEIPPKTPIDMIVIVDRARPRLHMTENLSFWASGLVVQVLSKRIVHILKKAWNLAWINFKTY